MKNIRLSLAVVFLMVSAVISFSKPYVILVSYDGFRWDYVSRNITPNLQKVIDNGVHALSLRPAFPSKTFPNHYSIVTGMYTEHHGIIANNFVNPETGDWYSMSDTVSKWDSKWYHGEPFWQTAEKNNIISASMFWPGSEQRGEGNHPTFFKYYDHNKPYFERVDTLINWLQLPDAKRPHFLTIYFHDTDSYGHEYGPNSSEVNESIKRLDEVTSYIMSSLNKIGMTDSVDIIFASDHGMTETSTDRLINLEEILTGYKYKLYDSGPVVRVHPADDQIDQVYEALKSRANHFRVYKKENIPSFYHYSESNLIPPVIVIADIGWALVDNKGFERSKKRFSLGNHGYEKDHTDMHGIFIAHGPSFKKVYNTGTLWNIDIYPLLAEIFGIKPNSKIDGKLERIEFILKDK